MQNPLISVIVPVYNSASSLIRCIDSILHQNYKNFELLLVDDGSVDGSSEICDSYQHKDTRVRVFHKANGGVSSARNLALDYVKGEFITFCDSDDYVEREWLSNFQDAIEENKDLAIQGYTIIDVNGKHTNTHSKLQRSVNCNSVSSLIVNLMSEGMYGFLWVKLFKTSIVKSYSLSFDLNSKFREDEQFFSEYLQYVKSFNVINREGYYYYLPAPKKNYKGNSYYSLPHIFRSLDVIFDNQLPKEICRLHYVNIKDMIISELLAKKIPEDYVLDLYGRFVEILDYKKGLKKWCLNTLIKKCKYFKYITFGILRILHCS